MAWPETIVDAAHRLREGAISSVELTTEAYARADRLDDTLGVYLARFDESALVAAAAADRDLDRGIDRGPLQGIPIGVKDVFASIEGPTTGQSLVHDPAWFAGRDATAVARLRAAGAVITGKLTTMEHAVGLPDPDKPFPVPRNPWDPSRWAGGSSSGAANGVASGLLFGAVGSDTGGSIRLPAAFCGVTGLKPSFGRVPTHGLLPLAPSLDHVGPIARSAADCAALLAVLDGSIPGPDISSAEQRIDGLRIGVERTHHFPPGSDPELSVRFDAALAMLEQQGAQLVDVTLAYYDELTTATMLTLSCEGLAVHAERLRTRWPDYYAATRLVLGLGALVSGADCAQAQRVRRMADRATARLFREVDMVVTPTAAMVAPTLEEMARGEVDLHGLVFTPYWSGIGRPALAVPIGPNAGGLPLSMQIAGAADGDDLILRVASAFQATTGWHRSVPPPTIEPVATAEPVGWSA